MYYNIIKLLTILSIVLLPFGDSPLQSSIFGIMGASLSFIPLILILILRIVELAYTKRIDRFSLAFYCLVGTSSFFGFIIFYDSVSLLYFFKNLVLYFLLLTPLCIDLKRESYKYAFLFAYIMVAVSIIFPSISDSNVFHGTINFNLRLRGFYAEASHLASSFYALSLIVLIYFKPNKYVMGLIIITTSYLLLFMVSSKGIIVTIFLSLFLIGLLKFRVTIQSFIMSLSFFILSAFFAYLFLSPTLSRYFESEEITSFSTRFTGFLAGIYSLVNYPLGVGFYGYKEALIQLFIEIREWSLIDFFEFSEIDTYIYRQSKNVSTKNLLSDWLVFFGVPGLVFIYFYFQKYWKLIKDDLLLLFGFISLFLILSVFSNGIGLYSLFFLLAVIHSHSKKNYH